MEDKETSTPSKPTYEQLEQVAMQMQQRLMVAENKLRSIDFTVMRLTWLFRVIENKEAFTEEFISKSSKEIEELLTLEEGTTEVEKE